MAFQDILVFVDESKQNARRLDLAVELAQRGDAHLIGLAVTLPVFFPDFVPPEVISRQQQLADERNQRLHQRFEERTGRDGVRSEWRVVEPPTATSVAEAVALHVRYADLAILAQPDPDDMDSGLVSDFPGLVALMSGRPILALPRSWRVQPIGRRVLIAWNASRESTRALHDALPLLSTAEEVRVLALTRRGGVQGLGDLPGADIATHLARHGITAQAEHGVVEDARVGESLLASAEDFGADLLVMGAYGRSRMREIVLGGASRSILRTMTLPVLMSH